MKLTLSIAIVILMFSSCTKNNSVSDAPSTNPNTQAQIIGNWVISSYKERSEDKTSQFEGIVFEFADAGKLTATGNNSVTTGTWIYRPSAVSYYGSTATKAAITINLGSDSPFTRLNRTWNIDSSSASVLIVLNPEPSNNERIQFSKK